MLTGLLYLTAIALSIYVIRNIVKENRFTTADAIAILGIIIALITTQTSVANSGPEASAEEANCSFSSAEGKEKTSITFVNATDHIVAIYWEDYHGLKRSYNQLDPGASYEQQTYVTHPWCVIDSSNGRALRSVIATRQPQIITIS